MTKDVSVSIFGNVESGRTEAEVSRDGVCVAIVYEDAGGWHAEPVKDSQAPLSREEIVLAQESLKVYVNRRGESPPPGLTAAGKAFWLMEKDDGTSMGAPVGGKPNAI